MNLLPLPKNFDQNEWVIIISCIALLLLLYIFPKRFPTSISILIIAFSIVVARVVDHLLAGPDINFYDVLDSGDYELFDLFSYIPYAPFAYVFVYLYDKLQIRGVYTSLYIIIFSLIAIGVEWITTSSFIHYFHYYSWEILYSFPIYLVIQPLTLLFYHFIIKVHARSLTSP
jgi:accessory gene regulator protein AgrB